MQKTISIILIITTLFGFWSASGGDFGFAEIKIIGQKDLDTKQTIAPDGTVSLPLLGRIIAQGQALGTFNKYLML